MTRYAMYFENTDISNGVTITNNGAACAGSTCTDITFADAGVYNIQFSAQLHNTGGGGAGEKTIAIWLGKNGADVPLSATSILVDTNSPYQVAAWNFFVTAAAGDRFQLFYAVDNLSIRIEHVEPGVVRPAIPSIILTVNQVG